MSVLHEYFATQSVCTPYVRILNGRTGLRQFLRIYQDSNPCAPARLHYRDVNALMLAGHFVLGAFNAQGEILAAGILILPDRPMPYRARMKDSDLAARCAVLDFVSTGTPMPYYKTSGQAALIRGACALARKNGRMIMRSKNKEYRTDMPETGLSPK